MITYKTGNIFDSTAKILVCPVNTVGVMGGGLALEFRNRYPLLNYQYKKACFETRWLSIGNPWMWYAKDGDAVLCFPTKEHWWNPSELTYIQDGLRTLVYKMSGALLMSGYNSIAFPKLGCGLGGLQWPVVKVVMETVLHDLVGYGFEVEIWE